RGLRLETRPHPGLPQLATPRVQLEDAEAESPAPLALHPQQAWLRAHTPPRLSPVLAPAGLHCACRAPTTHRILMRGRKRRCPRWLRPQTSFIADAVRPRRSNRVERESR